MRAAAGRQAQTVGQGRAELGQGADAGGKVLDPQDGAARGGQALDGVLQLGLLHEGARGDHARHLGRVAGRQQAGGAGAVVEHGDDPPSGLQGEEDRRRSVHIGQH